MMKVCREMSALHQEWRDNHEKLIMDTPEELFFKFLALASILPNYAEGWPIQLPSTYYTVLSSTISDRIMSSDDYKQPSWVGLKDKEAQLDILQVIREGAIAQCNELVEEDDWIDKS